MDKKINLTDTNYEPLLKDWVKHIKKINNQQELLITKGSKFFIPFMAIPTSVVKTIFIICDFFGVATRTKYLSLYIYEKFMCNQFWKLYLLNENKPHSNDWKRDCEHYANTAKLRLVSSIQLASKMDSHSLGLGITQVQSILHWLDPDQEYTSSIIITSEFKVFKTIDFEIPLVTSLDCIEVIMAVFHLQKNTQFYDTAIRILDLSYLQHQQLFSQLQFMAHGSLAKTKSERITFMTLEVNTLLLGGAIIVTTSSILNFDINITASILNDLEMLIRVDRESILILAKMLLALVMPADTSKIKIL